MAPGPCTLGAPTGGFAYDNERPRHRADVGGYLIGRSPITNGTFLTFVEIGGYQRREWWSDDGWSWKKRYGITRPGGWTEGLDSEWRVDGLQPLEPDRPVVHVSWFEADAFARAHGARLPSEAEWEKAATWDQERERALMMPWGDEPARPGVDANVQQVASGPLPVSGHPDGVSPCGCEGMIGDIWEWTASSFVGYPGFTAQPYREYSEVFIRPRVQGAARGLVGHRCARHHSGVPQLGLPAAPSDLLRLPNREGRDMRTVIQTDEIRIESYLEESDER